MKIVNAKVVQNVKCTNSNIFTSVHFVGYIMSSFTISAHRYLTDTMQNNELSCHILIRAGIQPWAALHLLSSVTAAQLMVRACGYSVFCQSHWPAVSNNNNKHDGDGDSDPAPPLPLPHPPGGQREPGLPGLPALQGGADGSVRRPPPDPRPHLLLLLWAGQAGAMWRGQEAGPQQGELGKQNICVNSKTWIPTDNSF